MNVIRSPPALGDFIPLAEHQQATPTTFFGGRPVLHYHAEGAKAWLPKSQRGTLPFFPRDCDAQPTGPDGDAFYASGQEACVEQKVDVFVTSEYLIIFCPATESGVEISYPTIALQGIQNLGPCAPDGAELPGQPQLPSVFIQLELSSAAADDGSGAGLDLIDLIVVPPHVDSAATTTNGPHGTNGAGGDGGDGDGDGDQTATTVAHGAAKHESRRLFDAMTACSELHPDPVGGDGDGDGDGDDAYIDRIVFEGAEGSPVDGLPGVFLGARGGGLPPPVAGSSGWITAGNMDQFFDKDGNWIEGDGEEMEGVSGVLGQGAGAVHARDDNGGCDDGCEEGADALEDKDDEKKGELEGKRIRRE